MKKDEERSCIFSAITAEFTILRSLSSSLQPLGNRIALVLVEKYIFTIQHHRTTLCLARHYVFLQIFSTFMPVLSFSFSYRGYVYMTRSLKRLQVIDRQNRLHSHEC